MSVKTRTMYVAVCDICGAEPPGWEGIVAWSDEDSADEVARDCEWTVKDGRHYCPNHFVCIEPGCHVALGPLAGEQDYLCDEHRAPRGFAFACASCGTRNLVARAAGSLEDHGYACFALYCANGHVLTPVPGLFVVSGPDDVAISEA